jgi:hypothetical protein
VLGVVVVPDLVVVVEDAAVDVVVEDVVLQAANKRLRATRNIIRTDIDFFNLFTSVITLFVNETVSRCSTCYSPPYLFLIIICCIRNKLIAVFTVFSFGYFNIYIPALNN